MRRNPLARTIIASAALTLLGSSVVSAQYGLTPPPRYPGVETVIVTSALDDASTNQRIEDFALEYHTDLGGKNTEKKNNGWFPVGPVPDTDSVVEAVLDMAAKSKGNVIVISGGDGQSNAGIARSFPNTIFIDLGQSRPCLTADGQPDPSGTCEGGENSIPYNYAAVDFAVEDGAYLSGVLAASASRNDRLGIISGFRDCEECNRYIGGFLEGARSVDPEIEVELAYLADDEVSGFGDPVAAKTFTKAFIDVYDPDVILPVGRGATIGMIEAACEAGKLAIGTGTDVTAAHPDLDCVLASVTKDVERALDEALYAFAIEHDPERHPLRPRRGRRGCHGRVDAVALDDAAGGHRRALPQRGGSDPTGRSDAAPTTVVPRSAGQPRMKDRGRRRGPGEPRDRVATAGPGRGHQPHPPAPALAGSGLLSPRANSTDVTAYLQVRSMA